MVIRLDNFLYSGFIFDEEEELLKFKFRMINLILLIIAFFSTIFGALQDFGLNDIGPIQSKVNYINAFCMMLILFFLRKSKDNYLKSVHLLLIFSLFTFTSALILVPQDEFRIIWFYLLILVAFILGGSKNGLLYTVLSMLIVLTCNYFIDLQLSRVAINSSILGLIIGSALSRVYTNKISDYQKILHERNISLKYLATIDGLTGIINRRHFDEIVSRYFEIAQRSNKNISMIVMDLDYFKKINDTYGHATGDKLLVAFAEKLKPFVRKGDMFARIGGEEFAIAMFNTNSKDASTFAEKICRETRNICIDNEDAKVTVTTSIGITQNKETDSTFDEMYIRADKALYQAKDDGRDRVCIVN